MSLQTRYEDVMEHISKAASRAGRDPGEVRLVAVSKTVDEKTVGRAIEAGIGAFGENRIEVMMPKAALYPDVQWHFIGNIQKRKIADIVHTACLIHSVDRADILDRLDRCAIDEGRVADILLEVNVSGEASKSGFRPDEVAGLLRTFDAYDGLAVRGLMTMAPQDGGEAIRATFAGLRHLGDELSRASLPDNVSMRELSMGMSEDYEIAIEEGATYVRVGRGIFSEDFEKSM